MRAIVTDAIALAAVRPLDLLAYLRAQGWSPLESPADAPLLDWWKDGDRGYVEVQVPRHPSWRDYARRIHDALSALAIEEARSQLDILRDIANVSRDVIRFRSVLEGRADGTLPLEDATRVTSAARGAMLAAACAAVEPRRSYPSRKPPAATAFLGQLSMGQTEHGSFVMTLFCPVMPALHGQASVARDGGAGAEPFNRRVTRTLGTALTAVTEAALAGVTTGDLTAFDDAVAAGVSADLCEALGQIKDCTAVTQLDIRLGWAAARPPSAPPRAVHELTRDALEVIHEAGRRLRERAPIDDFEVAGLVIDIDRPGDELAGHATVMAVVDGRPRKVRVAVAGAEWQRAVDTMARRVGVRYRGRLVREGKLYVLMARGGRDPE